jgi:hypothetical protein
MKLSLFSLALGLTSIAGFTEGTMIPNKMLGFTLPPKGATVARDVPLPHYDNVPTRPTVSVVALGVKLPITPPSSDAKVETRDDSAPKYEKRTMIPNKLLGFTLPAKGAIVARDAPVPRYDNPKRPTVSMAALGVKLPITPEAKVETRDDSASKYEKRTMIPNSKLGFTLPRDAKLASRAAAWQRVTKISN